MYKSRVALTLDSRKIIRLFVSLTKETLTALKGGQTHYRTFRNRGSEVSRGPAGFLETARLTDTPHGAAAHASLSPSRSAPPLAEWAVPQSSRLKYRQLFNSHDKTMSGHLTGTAGVGGERGLVREARCF